ncbi:hypothetical protein AMAG_03573 [Allomyces macrogynus ATCC 38327]|uniref:Uncharacterized protein n=1 Tax=Allomyces macrogynus (strain ATCC 38327) TaxID=578462 RepID=A0A0L0S9Z4_ALLM3|nr:hypothetical protein AMAG_03573 [Allomyces macrogynus ATCC 38327]|eukprot:KNE59262.1 hypothetical protein AMAG_03573 [Allomyces macrogynus ATCC 38327]
MDRRTTMTPESVRPGTPASTTHQVMTTSAAGTPVFLNADPLRVTPIAIPSPQVEMHVHHDQTLQHHLIHQHAMQPHHAVHVPQPVTPAPSVASPAPAVAMHQMYSALASMNALAGTPHLGDPSASAAVAASSSPVELRSQTPHGDGAMTQFAAASAIANRVTPGITSTTSLLVPAAPTSSTTPLTTSINGSALFNAMLASPTAAGAAMLAANTGIPHFPVPHLHPHQHQGLPAPPTDLNVQAPAPAGLSMSDIPIGIGMGSFLLNQVPQLSSLTMPATPAYPAATSVATTTSTATDPVQAAAAVQVQAAAAAQAAQAVALAAAMGNPGASAAAAAAAAAGRRIPPLAPHPLGVTTSFHPAFQMHYLANQFAVAAAAAAAAAATTSQPQPPSVPSHPATTTFSAPSSTPGAWTVPVSGIHLPAPPRPLLTAPMGSRPTTPSITVPASTPAPDSAPVASTVAIAPAVPRAAVTGPAPVSSPVVSSAPAVTSGLASAPVITAPAATVSPPTSTSAVPTADMPAPDAALARNSGVVAAAVAGAPFSIPPTTGAMLVAAKDAASANAVATTTGASMTIPQEGMAATAATAAGAALAGPQSPTTPPPPPPGALLLTSPPPPPSSELVPAAPSANPSMRKLARQLAEQESRIDLSVLRFQHGDDRHKKQRRFQRTVEAIFNIVQNKLYKARSSSLENYFRDTWRISRAQVYRFLDAAVILRELADFPDTPTRERLCRSLKKLTKNRQNRRVLWQAVLDKYGPAERDSVTSTAISNIWRALIKEGKVDPNAQPEVAYDSSDEDEDGDVTMATAPTATPVLATSAAVAGPSGLTHPIASLPLFAPPAPPPPSTLASPPSAPAVPTLPPLATATEASAGPAPTSATNNDAPAAAHALAPAPALAPASAAAPTNGRKRKASDEESSDSTPARRRRTARAAPTTHATSTAPGDAPRGGDDDDDAASEVPLSPLHVAAGYISGTDGGKTASNPSSAPPAGRGRAASFGATSGRGAARSATGPSARGKRDVPPPVTSAAAVAPASVVPAPLQPATSTTPTTATVTTTAPPPAPPVDASIEHEIYVALSAVQNLADKGGYAAVSDGDGAPAVSASARL